MINGVNYLIQTWASTQPRPDFFQVLDITHRIAGSGSLGLPRYLILVKGRGYPKGCYLLDLKAARRSSLTPFLTHPQPTWTSEGDRIVQIQTRLQASPPALLSAIEPSGQSYVLRELQPSNDKIDPTALRSRPKKLKALIIPMDLGLVVLGIGQDFSLPGAIVSKSDQFIGDRTSLTATAAEMPPSH